MLLACISFDSHTWLRKVPTDDGKLSSKAQILMEKFAAYMLMFTFKLNGFSSFMHFSSIDFNFISRSRIAMKLNLSH